MMPLDTWINIKYNDANLHYVQYKFLFYVEMSEIEVSDSSFSFILIILILVFCFALCHPLSSIKRGIMIEHDII